jgi:hypothetical protein
VFEIGVTTKVVVAKEGAVDPTDVVLLTQFAQTRS